MAQLVHDDVLGYMVDGQRLEVGMTIRRRDRIDGQWYEGEVRRQGGANGFSLVFVVEGYAPSPFHVGDDIEIVSKAELHNREMDERNRIVAENREKPWLPLHDGE